MDQRVLTGQGTPVSPIEQEFASYLATEQGLVQATVAREVAEVHRFLVHKFGRRPIVPGKIRAPDVAGFISHRAEHLSLNSARQATVALRAFFRFLRLRGDITTDLAGAVPAVARWRLAGLPKFIPASEVRKIIRQCDQSTIYGIRDYALILLVARLGLRSGEVAALTLDDINWDAGEILIRGKGLRRDQLPLPHDVGRALAMYLKRGRPASSSRKVFVTFRRPVRGIEREGVYCIIARAIDRAKLDTPTRGAHLLRHSLATDLLRRGAPMAEIAELLRHRHTETTALYAKVDVKALRALALPWPRACA